LWCKYNRRLAGSKTPGTTNRAFGYESDIAW
jgi:hypothetical protein